MKSKPRNDRRGKIAWIWTPHDEIYWNFDGFDKENLYQLSLKEYHSFSLDLLYFRTWNINVHMFLHFITEGTSIASSIFKCIQICLVYISSYNILNWNSLNILFNVDFLGLKNIVRIVVFTKKNINSLYVPERRWFFNFYI